MRRMEGRPELRRYQAMRRILIGESVEQRIPNTTLVAMYKAGDPTVRRLITEAIGPDRLWALLDVDTNGIRQTYGSGRPTLPIAQRVTS